jgi:hypothetical protein
MQACIAERHDSKCPLPPMTCWLEKSASEKDAINTFLLPAVGYILGESFECVATPIYDNGRPRVSLLLYKKPDCVRRI